MRRPLIAGNWKLHKTIAESLAMVEELKPEGLYLAERRED